MPSFIYILTNHSNTTLYIGVTSNLERRLTEHKEELIEGFSRKYHLHKLVYLEQFVNISEAIAREKQLKNWHREWKFNLIKAVNPEMHDLSEEPNWMCV